MVKKTISINKHKLIPEHSLCNAKEKEQILKKFNSTEKDFPKISIKDSGISHLNAKISDLIKIERKDDYTGTSVFYRVVTDE
jgi:DNA-directed RNA polymerase subunit H